jgi:hypothetical protein
MEDLSDLTSRQKGPRSARKRETTLLDINENTDGFITQIISDEMHSQHSHHSHNSHLSHRSNNSHTERNRVNVHLMDPTVLIPNKTNGQPHTTSFMNSILPINQSKSFVSFDLEEAKLSSTPPPPPPPHIPNLENLAQNSFINPENTFVFEDANLELKEIVTPKKSPNAKSKLQSFSMNGRLKQPATVNSRFNDTDKSNFTGAFKFLPNILSDNNHFPNRKNFHHRRIFLRYITNKIEKEYEFASDVKARASKSQTENTSRSHKISSSNKSTGKSRKNFNLIDDGAYYEDQQVFVDYKRADSPPPSQMERFNAKLKKQASNLTQANLRSKSLINQPDKKSTHTIEEDAKSAFTKPFTINSVKNVVDLNMISDSSRLSGHFLDVIQNKKRLADLNLNEMWPSSRMYKVSIKANPWVNSFKARTYANEVNTNFRNTLDYPNNRIETSKRNVSLLPNIKQIL